MKHSLTYFLYVIFFLSLLNYPIHAQTDDLSEIEKTLQTRIDTAKELEKGADKIRELKAILSDIQTNLPLPHMLQGKCLYEIGEIWYVEQQGDSAYPYYNRAKLIFEELEDWLMVSEAYFGLAASEMLKEDYQKMTTTLEEVQELGSKYFKQTDKFFGKLYNYFGVANYYTGNYELAIDVGKKEVTYYENKKDSSRLAIAYNNLGTLYAAKGDYGRAIEYYVFAEQLLLINGNADLYSLGTIYHNIGIGNYHLKRHDESKSYFLKQQKLLEHPQSDASPSEFISLYQGFGLSNLESGGYIEALNFFKKAEKIHESAAQTKKLETTLHNLGYVYLKLGEYVQAERYLKQTLAIYNKDHFMLGKVLRHIAMLETTNKNYEDALNYCQQGLKVLMDSTLTEDILSHPKFIDFSTPDDIFKTLRDKANLLFLISKNQQNPIPYLKASFETFSLGSAAIDSMRTIYENNSKTFWNGEVKPFYEQAITVAYQLYQLENSSIYLEKAFHFAEKSKASLLAEALRESTAKSSASIPKDLLQQEKDLKIDITFYQKKVFDAQQSGSSTDSNKLQQWQALLFSKKQAYNQLLLQLEREYPEYFQLKYQNNLISLSDLQSNLSEGQGMIEYFYGEESIFIFTINHLEIALHKIPREEELDHLLTSFTKDLSNRSLVSKSGRSQALYQTFAEQSYALYRKLISSAYKDKAFEQLIIIADGPLGFLPFELLIMQPSSNPKTADYSSLDYLLKHTAIRYEYSANVLYNSPKRPKSNTKFLGFAPDYKQGIMTDATREGNINCDIDTYSQFASLKNNQQEVSDISSLLYGEAFLADHAAEQTFKQNAEKYGIIHFAMHAFVNHCDPLYSGLAFTPSSNTLSTTTVNQHTESIEDIENDGLLYAYEIYNMHLNAELVALSACNTGIGQLAPGEGIMSLARAFKYAGSKNILMSLWQADDATTAKIMFDFYQLLYEGMEKDKALQQAKLNFLNKNIVNHPFYWGTFVLIGDNTPMNVRSNAWPQYLLLIFAFIFSISGILWLVFKKRQTK